MNGPSARSLRQRMTLAEAGRCAIVQAYVLGSILLGLALILASFRWRELATWRSPRVWVPVAAWGLAGAAWGVISGEREVLGGMFAMFVAWMTIEFTSRRTAQATEVHEE
ncbi:MAG: hypothetical protein ACO1SX_14040 [Actinomycetota bacterium]